MKTQTVLFAALSCLLTGCPEDEERLGARSEDTSSSFENDTASSFASLEGMVFSCDYGDEDAALLSFVTGGALVVEIQDQVLQGTFSVDGNSLAVTVLDLGYEETSTAEGIELDRVVAFQLPSMYCHAVATSQPAQIETEVLRCPSIRYIPTVAYEDNEFHLSNSGTVRWRHWDELLGANDTLYSNHYGIYVTIGDRIFMVFGDETNAEDQFLSGTISDSGILIDQLEPEKGACVTS